MRKSKPTKEGNVIMSRLDKMWEIFEANASITAVKPINPKSKEILKSLIDKAIPMMTYYSENDIKEAIFNDAIDEGLNAFDIHEAIEMLFALDKYHNYRCMTILFGLDRIANAHLTFKRSADIARMDEIDDMEDQDKEV